MVADFAKRGLLEIYSNRRVLVLAQILGVYTKQRCASAHGRLDHRNLARALQITGRQIGCYCTDQVELWFSDESGIEGDPRPRRRWSARGSRPQIAYLGDHIRSNVIGAVCPANGHCFTMIYDGVDTNVFQHYLDQLAQAVAFDPQKRRILIVDNASWHKSSRLNWHYFQPLFLPTYSPDFNPIERLWLRLKADWFSDFIARTPEELTERLSTALCHFMDDHPTVASQCSFRK